MHIVCLCVSLILILVLSFHLFFLSFFFFFFFLSFYFYFVPFLLTPDRSYPLRRYVFAWMLSAPSKQSIVTSRASGAARKQTREGADRLERGWKEQGGGCQGS